MKELKLISHVKQCQMEELPPDEQALISMAIEATGRSYAPYSHFRVGAAVELSSGLRLMGCNQENAAFPSGLCAERAAIFAAGAQYPDQPVISLAIAARGTDGELTEEPVSPCGTCRQVIIETETRFNRKVRILLYGKSKIFVIDGIKELMPLSFTEF